MKKTILLLIFLIPAPSIAHEYYSSYKDNQKCYAKLYREKYIQGTFKKPGYVRKWHETIRIPCQKHKISKNDKTFKRNDYQQKIKKNLNDFWEWIQRNIADWKLNQSDNYLNKDQ